MAIGDLATWQVLDLRYDEALTADEIQSVIGYGSPNLFYIIWDIYCPDLGLDEAYKIWHDAEIVIDHLISNQDYNLDSGYRDMMIYQLTHAWERIGIN